jgi:malonyl-CoA/methylmalonyl-CoA synthetase
VLTGVQELGGEPAVTIDGQALSYGELREAAAAVAHAIHGAERVAVWAESSLECCVAATAALCAGIPLIPINPKLGRAELEYVLSDSNPRVVLGAPKGALPDLAEPPREMAVDVTARRVEMPDVTVTEEDPALIIYTSGTTGRPKGAVLPRRSLASNLDALAEAWAWTADDVVVQSLPLFHVHGLVVGTFGPLRRGGELLHLGRFTPETTAAALRDRGTVLFAVPTMYHRLGEQAESDVEIADGLASARLLVSGSAPLPAAEFARIERLTGQQVVERYGMTETLMNLAVRADGVRKPGYVGVPVDGVDVRLVDDDGTVLEQSDGETIAEVVVRGPNVFSGYLDRPEATAEVLRDGWFVTGDLATRDGDGYWRIVGRRSTDLIKTGGFKVGAGEVEAALLEHPGVAEVAVTSAPDDDLGERIVAWVVVNQAQRPSARALIDHVASELGPHKRPREVNFLHDLPRNAMGKVLKKQLTDAALSASSTEAAQSPARHATD